MSSPIVVRRNRCLCRNARFEIHQIRGQVHGSYLGSSTCQSAVTHLPRRAGLSPARPSGRVVAGRLRGVGSAGRAPRATSNSVASWSSADGVLELLWRQFFQLLCVVESSVRSKHYRRYKFKRRTVAMSLPSRSCRMSRSTPSVQTNLARTSKACVRIF